MGEFATFDNLRLAAYALIEWRTPREATAYKEVLNNIIEMHPFARALGVLPNQTMFEMDDDSILLAYLARTMTANSFAASSDSSADQMTPRFLRMEATLYLKSASLGVRDAPLWTGGPLRSVVSYNILRSMYDFEGRCSALYAVISLVARLNTDFSKKFVLRLVIRDHVLSVIVGQLSTQLKNLTVFVKQIRDWSIYFGGAWFVLVFLCMGSTFKGGSLILSHWRMIIWLFFAGAGAHGVKDILQRTNAFGGVAKILIRGASRGRESEINPELIVAQMTDSDFESLIGFSFLQLCDSETGVLRELLQAQPSSRWTHFALSASGKLTRSVMKELIILLRSPELDEQTKYRLLGRLARAEVEP